MAHPETRDEYSQILKLARTVRDFESATPTHLELALTFGAAW